MTIMPTPGALAEDAPIDAQLQARVEDAGLSAVLAEVTRSGFERILPHLADPMVTNSRAAYLAWLRRQLRAWSELRLPSMSVVTLDWPLASVRPQCLDVVGLLVADLREISPRMRPTVVPWQATGAELPQPGVVVAAADLCVRMAAAPARLLGPAQALTEGMTHTGSSTRFLARCAELADRAPGLAREIDRWAGTAGPVQSQLAAHTARRLADNLATALDAQAHMGW